MVPELLSAPGIVALAVDQVAPVPVASTTFEELKFDVELYRTKTLSCKDFAPAKLIVIVAGALGQTIDGPETGEEAANPCGALFVSINTACRVE
jgi:hypothetical protein